MKKITILFSLLFIATIAMAQSGVIDRLEDKYVLAYSLLTTVITFLSAYIPFFKDLNVRLRNVMIAFTIVVAILWSGVSLSNVEIIIGFIIQKFGYTDVLKPLGIKTPKTKKED